MAKNLPAVPAALMRHLTKRFVNVAAAYLLYLLNLAYPRKKATGLL